MVRPNPTKENEHYASSWYDMPETEEIKLMKSNPTCVGYSWIYTYYRQFFKLGYQYATCGGLEKGYGQKESQVTNASNYYQFGQGEAAPTTCTDKNYVYGAGGGGYYGGKAIADAKEKSKYPNVSNAAAMGGAGYYNSSRISNVVETMGIAPYSDGHVSITFAKNITTLMVQLNGVATYNGDSIVALFQGMEFDSLDLSDIVDGIKSGEFEEFEVLSGDGTINGKTFTFGKSPTVISLKTNAELETQVYYREGYEKYRDLAIIEAKQSDTRTKEFVLTQIENGKEVGIVTSDYLRGKGAVFKYIGNAEEYTIPISGLYTITCNGAGGTNVIRANSTTTCGEGSIAYATFFFLAGTKLYVNVGASPEFHTNVMYGGGGTKGSLKCSWNLNRILKVNFNTDIVSSNGAGSTDVRLINSTGQDGLLSRLVTAGGGGGTGRVSEWYDAPHCHRYENYNDFPANNLYAQSNTNNTGNGNLLYGSNGQNTSTQQSAMNVSIDVYNHVNAWQGTLSYRDFGGNIIGQRNTEGGAPAWQGSAVCAGAGGGGWFGGSRPSGVAHASVNGTEHYVNGFSNSKNGGTSKINSGYTYNGITYEATGETKIVSGAVTSDGSASISYSGSAGIDYQNTVLLIDKAAPDTPQIEVSRFNKDGSRVYYKLNDSKIDNGTDYQFKLQSLHDKKVIGEYISEQHTVTSGFKGWYYVINEDSYYDIASSGLSGATFVNKDALEVEVDTVNEMKFFHIAAVDYEGNISETADLQIRKWFYDLEYELNGGFFDVNTSHPSKAFYDVDFSVSNPTRYGFEFQGWTITNMDYPGDGNEGDVHYYGADKNSYSVTDKTHLNYTETKKSTWFKNLRNKNYGETVYFEAVWKDTTAPRFGNIYGEKGITYQNREDKTNPDKFLHLATLSSYTVNTYTESNLKTKNIGFVGWKFATDTQLEWPVNEKMPNNFSVGYYQNEDKLPVNMSTYPNYFGTTFDGQRYYPGTWTNKTVEIVATAYDGADDDYPNRNGGSGFALSVWFDNDTPKKTGNALSNNMQVEEKKRFVNSGIYNGTVHATDRAGTTNNEVGSKWIPNENGNFTTSIKYGPIKIDKEKPVIMDPFTKDTKTQAFRESFYMMYEGYNDIRDKNDLYGWANNNIKIVIYATDEHSGIKAQAYCWDKDPNIASNWQSADETRLYNGKTIPVSTKVVTQNTYGYVYVRDAVGNWSRIDYKVDHLDKQVPDVYPDRDPDPIPTDPVKPDPLDPDDPLVNPYNPVPDGPYNFEGVLNTNEIKYDWINHDGTLSFSATDYGVSNTGDKGKNEDRYGSSGIYRMTLLRSNENFPLTMTDTILGGKPKMIANRDLYGDETIVYESNFETHFEYTETREGISYFILEVEDKAGNLTLVKLTVKIDKTYPGIPHTNGTIDVVNSYVFEGNDDIANFSGVGKYWEINQADLNNVDYDKIEAYIRNEDNMKCEFNFVIYDENWTGNYAYGSDRTIDDSGLDYVKLTLFDADNTNVSVSYPLYDYSDRTKEGINSKGEAFTTAIVEHIDTQEAGSAYFASSLTGDPYSAISTKTKINTFKDFPRAAALNYQLEIADRAGNVKVYVNEPGNEIRNFSIKAVMNSAEDNEYNNEVEHTISHSTANEVEVNRTIYVYKDRKNREYSYSYPLTSTEEASKGLTLVDVNTEVVTSTTNIDANITAITNVPYYQLGDMGFVDIWTVGYVPEVQFDFGLFGDPIGDEMVMEIQNGKIPSKYNLGVLNDLSYARIIQSSVAKKIDVSYAEDVGGIPFASHYGVKEREDFVNPIIDTQRGWLDRGSSIRIPIYYPLTKDGGKNSDGTPTYISELHNASFIAHKGNWKATSNASYILYDTRQNDIHYRITHES